MYKDGSSSCEKPSAFKGKPATSIDRTPIINRDKMFIKMLHIRVYERKWISFAMYYTTFISGTYVKKRLSQKENVYNKIAQHLVC